MIQEIYNKYRDLVEMPDQIEGDKLSPEERHKLAIMSAMIGCITYMAAILTGILLCMMLGSCTTTKYVPVIEHHTDTLIQNTVRHDSIMVKDSIYVQQNGDTVRIERWHTKYVEKQVHDTTYVSKTDSIPQPYPVIKEVPAELTWWQDFKLHVGGIVVWLLIIGIVVLIVSAINRGRRIFF